MVGNEITRGMVQSSVMIEPHYSIGFYAELWGLSEDTVRRWFQDEPGVLRVGEVKRGKRARIELRIPWSVANRVYRERTKSK